MKTYLALILVLLPSIVSAQSANRAVVATLVSERVTFETNEWGDQLIVTHGQLSVVGSTEMIEAVWPGGTIGQLTLRVSELPAVAKGDRAIFILTPTGHVQQIVPVIDNVDAFVLNGPAWPTATVPYYVNPVNADVSEAAALAALEQGASAWGLQSQASIALAYAGPTTGTAMLNNGKNEVFFRNTSNGGIIAETHWWYDGSNHLIDADILFYDGGFHFYTGTSGCSGGAYIEDIATHEFGHALGLGHSTVSGATMYPSYSYCSEAQRSLAADDIAAIETVYPPGVVVPPTPPPPTGYVLTATGKKVKGYQVVTLAWYGTTATTFSVFRDGAAIATVAVPAYTDQLLKRGGGSYRYQVCNAGTATCSNVVIVQF